MIVAARGSPCLYPSPKQHWHQFIAEKGIFFLDNPCCSFIPLTAKAAKSGLVLGELASIWSNWNRVVSGWMDVCESKQALGKHRAGETPRTPLAPAEKNNAITTGRSATREVSSRHRSPSPASSSGRGRSPSPNLTKTTHATSKLSNRRAQSAERKRPVTPPSALRPSTPVQDSSVDVHLSSRRLSGSRFSEILWPSTRRSLSVSFQSDAISIPVSKKEKPVTSASDRTLRPASNVAHKVVETPSTRKPTPERKRSPLKGKNASDHSENSKPLDGLHSRLIDQHRWPSRVGGKVSSNALNLSVDHADKTIRKLNTSVPGTGVPSRRRLSLPGEMSEQLQKALSGADKTIRTLNTSVPGTGVSSQRRLSLLGEVIDPLQKASSGADKIISTLNTSVPGTGVSSRRRLSLPGEVSDPLQKASNGADKTISTLNTSVPGTGVSSRRRLSLPCQVGDPLQKPSSGAAGQLLHVEGGRIGNEVKSIDDTFQVLRSHKSVPTIPSDKTGLTNAGVRSQSLPSTGSRPPSPIKNSVLSSTSSRGVSPSRSRPSTPPPRGVSPSRIRSSNSSSQSNNSTSVLSFAADLKKGAIYIEDAHQLRLLYNRYLQWRFVNARAEDEINIQNADAEITIYNVWKTTLSMRESIIRKRINLQQMQLELKLNSILNDQMTYLDDWAVLESDHDEALAGAIEDFEASTLRLPLTAGAKVDIEHLKVAICSAVDVMQAMGPAICSSLSRVESMNNLISEVAVVSAQEKTMLEECEALLTFVAAMQAEENRLRTHFMQITQSLDVNK